MAPRWRLYVFAVVLTGVTLLLRLGMKPWDGGQPLLILFLFPIVISAYLGGLGPGLLATGLTAVVTDYFLVPPTYAFGFASPVAFAHWLFLLLVGVLISVLFNELDRLRRGRADEALEGRHITTERKVGLGFAAALTLLGNHRHCVLSIGGAAQREFEARGAFPAGDGEHRRHRRDHPGNRIRESRLPDLG